MKYPEFLKEGQTIGFAAPSYGASTEPYYSAFRHAAEKLRTLGYRTVLGPNVYASSGTGISASPASWGKELESLYLSPGNQALISVGGGELMCEILDYIDFEKIQNAKPKWYMGYSDNTNFTFLLATLADTAAIYGPCASDFGTEPWHESVSDAFRLLTGRKLTVHGYERYERIHLRDALHPYAPVNPTEPTRVVSRNWDKAPVSGRLLGGCMDILVTLLGTKFDRVQAFTEKYREDGILWFLEACDLSVYGIRRAMWQMAHAGWFRYVKAFIIGRPLNGDAAWDLDRFDAVMAAAGEYQVPVIMDCDIGHVAPMMPVISGSFATVRPYGETNIEIEYQFI